jgi:dihydroxyacetone kinase-like protein
MLNTVVAIAITGMEATRDMIATKGRASFLEQRSIGHIDAGAKTAQLMISAIVGVLIAELSASA